jgi:hypothetical protein
MLVHFHSSAVNAAVAGETTEPSAECLDLFLRMHHEGHHLISVAPADLPRLASLRSRLSRRANSALLRIQEKAFDGRAHPSPGDAWVIRAPLHHFDRITRASRSILMGENLTDVSFYVELGYLALAARSWRNIALRYERVTGGGSSFAQVFEHQAGEERIILAIADSDRKQPGGPPGSTWRELEKRSKQEAQERRRYQRARETHTREAENLPALDVYDRVFRSSNAKDPRLATLRELRRLSDVERAHTDLKKSLGDHVLEQVLQWLQRERLRSPVEVAALFGLPGNLPLATLCEEIISWGCAFPEMLT